MSRRPAPRLTAKQSSRSANAAITRAHLFEGDVDAQRRIDHYIDYFGSGAERRRRVTPDPCGESLLDADGTR